MSGLPYDKDDPHLLDAECRKCHAQVGEHCTQPSGALAPWQHSCRYSALREREREVHL